jgi:ESS family glutamate:Na+ symporter
VGCGLVLLLLKPLFDLPDVFAGIMPVGFEGGHGTAGGMGPVFDQLGYPEMKDLALASATGGILGAIIVGMALINWAARKGYVEKVQVRSPLEQA